MKALSIIILVIGVTSCKGKPFDDYHTQALFPNDNLNPDNDISNDDIPSPPSSDLQAPQTFPYPAETEDKPPSQEYGLPPADYFKKPTPDVSLEIAVSPVQPEERVPIEFAPAEELIPEDRPADYRMLPLLPLPAMPMMGD